MLEGDIQASKRVKPKPKNGLAAKKAIAAKKRAKGLDTDDDGSEEDWKPAAAKKLSPAKKAPEVPKPNPVPKAAPVVPAKRDRWVIAEGSNAHPSSD
jgi:hypothetical protein